MSDQVRLTDLIDRFSFTPVSFRSFGGTKDLYERYLSVCARAYDVAGERGGVFFEGSRVCGGVGGAALLESGGVCRRKLDESGFAERECSNVEGGLLGKGQCSGGVGETGSIANVAGSVGVDSAGDGCGSATKAFDKPQGEVSGPFSSDGFTASDLSSGVNSNLERNRRWRQQAKDRKKKRQFMGVDWRSGRGASVSSASASSEGFWGSCSVGVRQQLIDSKAMMHVAENKRRTREAEDRLKYLDSPEALMRSAIRLVDVAGKVAKKDNNNRVYGWAATVANTSAESLARSAPSSVPSFAELEAKLEASSQSSFDLELSAKQAEIDELKEKLKVSERKGRGGSNAASARPDKFSLKALLPCAAERKAIELRVIRPDQIESNRRIRKRMLKSADFYDKNFPVDIAIRDLREIREAEIFDEGCDIDVYA